MAIDERSRNETCIFNGQCYKFFIFGNHSKVKTKGFDVIKLNNTTDHQLNYNKCYNDSTITKITNVTELNNLWQNFIKNQKYTSFNQFYENTIKKNNKNYKEHFKCQYKLRPLKFDIHTFNTTFALGSGASTAKVFEILDQSSKFKHLRIIVKIWCNTHVTSNDHPCTKTSNINNIRKSIINVNLAKECGFENLLANVWAAPIYGIVENTNEIIDTIGLFSYLLDGASLRQLTFSQKAKTKLNLTNLSYFFQYTVKKNEIKDAAIYDLWTSQCDRHDENVFLTESGNIILIDNEQSFSDGWRKCGYDSIFLPKSQKYQINYFGNDYVIKKGNSTYRTNPNPELLFDYRCATEKNEINLDYNVKTLKCMKKISKMTNNEIMAKYGFKSATWAQALKNRSDDMLRHGFEWTLNNGYPKNTKALDYSWQKPCCHMKLIDGIYPAINAFECEDSWKPNLILH